MEKSRVHPAPGLPTFVGVIQLEDIGVLGVVRQLHHPAHHGDFFAGCGFVLGKNNSITRRPMPLTPGGSRAGPGKFPSRPPPQLNHPKSQYGESSSGTYVFSVCAPQGLGSVVQEGGSREYDPVPGP